MTKDLVPRRSPELLSGLINDDYGYTVNCSYPHSFRVLNRRQYEILQEVDGVTDLATLADKLVIAPELLEKFLAQLSRMEIIRFDDAFSAPQKPASPKALNFWIHT
ncbi:radical SAM protein, partial [Pedobacter sp. HMF7056]|nr:radical SAM protein [Hufsiella ginkgonis]